MTQTEQELTILSEECNETAQRVSKAIRFGLEEIQEGQPLTNAQRIVYEFNDIVAMMELLHEQGELPTVIDREAIEKKKEKVRRYMAYSAECGTVSESIELPIHLPSDWRDKDVRIRYCKHCEKVTAFEVWTELTYDDGSDEPNTSNKLLPTELSLCLTCGE